MNNLVFWGEKNDGEKRQVNNNIKFYGEISQQILKRCLFFWVNNKKDCSLI